MSKIVTVMVRFRLDKDIEAAVVTTVKGGDTLLVAQWNTSLSIHGEYF
jgi:hypothetical protein